MKLRSIRAIAATLARLTGCSRGATAVEYGLIVSLIVIAMLASFMEMANTTTTLWGNIGSKVANAR